METVGGIALGVGVAAAAAGLIWHFAAPSAQTTSTALRLGPSVAPGYVGIAMGGVLLGTVRAMAPPGNARFEPARLVSSESLGGGLSLLEIEPGERVAASYVSPGQYTEVRANGETGYFVLANDPGSRRWHLIMKSGGGASDVLLLMKTGSPVEVRPALGDGFPMQGARARPLVVVLGGSGLAAGRPLLRRRLAEGAGERTFVFIALRKRDEIALEADMEAWSRAGAEVVICLSQEEVASEGPRAAGTQATGVRHLSGRIQDVLSEFSARKPGAIANALVFAVGTVSMVDVLRDVAPSLGVRRDDVVTNY